MSQRRDDPLERYPEKLISLVSGRWKLLILWHLLHKRTWFNELKRDLGNISSTSLINQLNQLQEDGLIARKVFDTTPPEVEYFLTPIGRAYEPVFKAFSRVGKRLS